MCACMWVLFLNVDLVTILWGIKVHVHAKLSVANYRSRRINKIKLLSEQNPLAKERLNVLDGAYLDQISSDH